MTSHLAVKPLALVLGACTPAGRELARHALKRGCTLLLCDPDGDQLASLRHSLGQQAELVQMFEGDPADPRQRRELLRFLLLADAKPDIVVFVHGESLQDPQLSAPPKATRRFQESGLLALDGLLRGGILPDMLREGNGFVLVVLDAHTLAPRPGQAMVSAMGAGMAGYLGSLSRELRPRGVTLTLCACAAGREQLLQRHPAPGVDVGQARMLARRAFNALFGRRTQVSVPGAFRQLLEGAARCGPATLPPRDTSDPS